MRCFLTFPLKITVQISCHWIYNQVKTIWWPSNPAVSLSVNCTSIVSSLALKFFPSF